MARRKNVAITNEQAGDSTHETPVTQVVDFDTAVELFVKEQKLNIEQNEQLNGIGKTCILCACFWSGKE